MKVRVKGHKRKGGVRVKGHTRTVSNPKRRRRRR